MEKNRSIVDTITARFLLRLAEQEGKTDLAKKIGDLLKSKEKPKSDEFQQIFADHVANGGKAE